jgi:hypothetical protein
MRQFVLSLLLLHLAACSGMQTIPLRDLRGHDRGSALQVGDRVELVTHDNEKLDFALTEVTDDGVAGKFGFIPYDDIRRLRVHRPGAGNAAGLTWLWGVLGAAAVIALLSSADSVTVCAGAPCPQPAK